jgi:hypothetical protein
MNKIKNWLGNLGTGALWAVCVVFALITAAVLVLGGPVALIVGVWNLIQSWGTITFWEFLGAGLLIMLRGLLVLFVFLITGAVTVVSGIMAYVRTFEK